MTSRIQILSPDLADKIAAGEVVERPASVVKELVENSIDAGAASVRVDIFGAGKNSIRVSDDGCGMTAEELSLSIQRHATSKIRTIEDLFEISTLGFRGEALPSIGAVSDLTLETKPKSIRFGEEALEGTRLEVHGGKVLSVSPVGCAQGTMIRVENLFYNTPARLKFLKSDALEVGHIENALLCLALGSPSCAFELFFEEKLKLSAPVAKNPLTRLEYCLGKNFVEDALFVEENHPECRLQGWVLHPRQTGGTASGIYFFLNGRFLRDRVLQHALSEAYGDFLMKGRNPKAVLYLQMPLADVDVNVHPSKREVRFQKPQQVHQFVVKAVKKVLQRKIYGGTANETDRAFYHSNPKNRHSSNVSERALFFGNTDPWRGRASANPIPGSNPSHGYLRNETSPKEARLEEGETRLKDDGCKPEESPLSFSSLNILGIFAQTYILCETPDSVLLLIDQHAAHERIGYEKLKKNFKADEVPSQRLLLPTIWDATPRQAAALQIYLENLKKFGLVLETFGGNSFSIESVPLLLRENQIPVILEKLAAELEESSSSRSLEETFNHVLKTTACHAQVRAGDPLAIEEIRHLLQEMDEYRAMHCPHGRPTFVAISKTEIGKWFKRT